MEKPWYWEGNVQSSLARHLRIAGWTLTSAADTASKEQGTDLVLSKGDRTLLIEVKGFPTTVYESGPLVGQPKPTSPNTQARQWFSHATLKVMMLRSDFPDADVAMGLPRFTTYLNLIRQATRALEMLNVGVYLVDEFSNVELVLP